MGTVPPGHVHGCLDDVKQRFFIHTRLTGHWLLISREDFYHAWH